MPFDWHLVIDIAGFTVILIGGGVGYGKLQQKVRDMAKTVEGHADTLKDHAAQLADGTGNFKVIDTKLDYITKSLDQIANQLSSHVNGERR